ncbi:hypothetical protein RNI52_25760 [Labrys neptuniae]|uniref:Uncharacterized protein n=1 Tax=Labrys neptuniae TaxID=376174 RepID=A0ABV3PHN5_9HYPH|nr:hypothetical protein [Labrys neptuniae]MDT3380757.1 hypothetical protein [Labrys neptuniae]
MTRNDIAETIFASFLLGLAVLLLLSSGVLAAEPFTSAYTSFDTAKCPHQPGGDEEDYGSWRCPGYRGLPMRLSAGDQRMFVSFGKAGANDIAANETFAAFNSADHGTVEWRLAAGQRQPFATILQWQVMTEADHKAEAKGSSPASGRVLVVTRLGKDGTCHVGYVDARANGDANRLARKIADEQARSFRCGQDKPVVLGAVSPGLILPGKAR